MNNTRSRPPLRIWRPYCKAWTQPPQKRITRRQNARARQLQNIWTARYPTLCVLMEHRALQEAGVTLGTLQPLAGDESDDLRPTIRQCQTELAEIYDNSKVTVGNIF